MAGLSQDVRKYLVRSWFVHELGREPSAKEQADRAAQIDHDGVDVTFAAIFDSTEAQGFRKRRGW